jgi:threonine/homoserine/homoserine lactone efflux protein
MNGNEKACNAEVIKGIVALVIGVILIALAYKVILQILFFFCGLFLVYYGLAMLKMEQVRVAIDSSLQTIKQHMPKITK